MDSQIQMGKLEGDTCSILSSPPFSFLFSFSILPHSELATWRLLIHSALSLFLFCVFLFPIFFSLLSSISTNGKLGLQPLRPFLGDMHHLSQLPTLSNSAVKLPLRRHATATRYGSHLPSNLLLKFYMKIIFSQPIFLRTVNHAYIKS